MARWMSAVALVILAVGSCVDPAMAAPSESRAGWLHDVWFDGPPGSALTGHMSRLVDDQGRGLELRFDASAARMARGLVGTRVIVRGRRGAAVPETLPRAETPPAEILDVEAIQSEAPPSPPPSDLDPQPLGQSGPAIRPQVVILCRFADSPATAPGAEWFEGLIGSAYPGMDHFWREVSYDDISLTGSEVHGWYSLPGPRSDYLHDRNGDGDTNDPEDQDLDKLMQDCAAAADADVFFPSFSGIDVMVDDDFGCCARGGSTTLTLDGFSANYGATWLPRWAWLDQGFLAHEMGHAFGLPHSSGPYGKIYDSGWDVMSAPTALYWKPGCEQADPVYDCVGRGTIAYHKDILGWIPLSRKLVVGPGMSQSVLLERLSVPGTAGYLMIQIPRSGTGFYTVEARRRAGYDGADLPGEAVVIHDVDPARVDRLAQVVDADGDGDPNDAGAMWRPGQTFVDAQAGITVSVGAETADGFLVTVSVFGDTTPPDTTIVSGPLGHTSCGEASFAWTGTDDITAAADLGYASRLIPVETDFTAFSGATRRSFAGLPEGGYAFEVKARDAAGNEDPVPARRDFTVGPSAPGEIVVDDGDPGTSFTGRWCAQGSPTALGGRALVSCGVRRDTYRWTPRIPQSRRYDVYVRWVAAPTRSAGAPFAVTHAEGRTVESFDERLHDGEWVWHGRYPFLAGTAGFVETGDAGGQASVDAVRLVAAPVESGDTTPPDTAIMAGPAGTIAEATATFTWTGADDTTATPDLMYASQLAPLESSFSPFARGTSRSFVGLADGTYTLSVKARDAGGNEDPDPARQSFTVRQNPAREVIVDNGAPGTSATGRWCSVSAPTAYGSAALVSCGGRRDTYRWTPVLPVSGPYDVYVRWAAAPTRSATAPFTVAHAGGSAVRTYDERASDGVWVWHGRYVFGAGSAGHVETSDLHGQASADAVRFVLVP